MTKKYELTGLGNAIVDVIAQGSDAFLSEHGIAKGGMTLIDQDRTRTLYKAMGPGQEVSGGSAANTLAGFASLGGRGAFIGKVADDQLGQIFSHDMNAIGVHYNTPPLKDGPETARCMIIVTPDGQRSMNTFLGASVQFNESDVDEMLIGQSAWLYLEGYLYDSDSAKRAYVKASKAARASGAKVALTLSDAFCVDRHRADFQTLVRDNVDLVFANEAEIMSLYQSKTLDDALAEIRKNCDMAVVTLGKNGAVILRGDETARINVRKVDKVVDTTGAGDQFAAGVLFGLARNFNLQTCGDLGALAAAEVISHIGPRPMTPMAELAAKELGLKLVA